nr:MAG TPA: hypothetical protein [Bacteriophage sp.]
MLLQNPIKTVAILGERRRFLCQKQGQPALPEEKFDRLSRRKRGRTR